MLTEYIGDGFMRLTRNQNYNFSVHFLVNYAGTSRIHCVIPNFIYTNILPTTTTVLIVLFVLLLVNPRVKMPWTCIFAVHTNQHNPLPAWKKVNRSILQLTGIPNSRLHQTSANTNVQRNFVCISNRLGRRNRKSFTE